LGSQVAALELANYNGIGQCSRGLGVLSPPIICWRDLIASHEAGRLTVAQVYALRSICRRLRVVFGVAAELAGQGLRQLVFFPALLIMTWGSLAESPEDYKYPIGKIDAQIRCRQDGHEAIEDALTDDATCMKEFGDTVARSDDDLIIKLDNNKTKVIRGNAKACQQGPVDDCVVYKLVGFIGGPRQLLLRRLLYESVFVDLVSRRTGIVTKLEGYPHLSPNGKQFVTVAASDAWTIEGPIAIYSNTDPPKLVWRFPQPSEYEQYSFDGWDGEDRETAHDFEAFYRNGCQTCAGWLDTPQAKWKNQFRHIISASPEGLTLILSAVGQ
jgi:hypothetical protein